MPGRKPMGQPGLPPEDADALAMHGLAAHGLAGDRQALAGGATGPLAEADEAALLGIAGILRETIGLEVETLGRNALAQLVRQRQAALHKPATVPVAGAGSTPPSGAVPGAARGAAKTRSATAGVVGLASTAGPAASLSQYWQLLQNSPAEREALAESAVVSETWFNRDAEAFRTFARLMAEAGRSGVRVLSLPCATGEEPLSIAMALLDAGLAPGSFRIDAVDVSTAALARADKALYGHNAFRGRDLDFRATYFEAVGDLWRPSALLRRSVQYRRANLFDRQLPVQLQAGQGGYDAIFCRNLLIYFDRDGQADALRRLHGLLAPDGLLFVGPAETGLPLREDFVWTRLPRAFAFRRALPGQGEGSARTTPAVSGAGVLSPTSSSPRAKRRRSNDAVALVPSVATQPSAMPAAAPSWAAPVTPKLKPHSKTPSPSPSQSGLAVAQPLVAQASVASSQPIAAGVPAIRQLADRGQVAEALEQCEALLRDEPSADAYALLGLLQESAGLPQPAVASYRRALYLDPAHSEALVHLAVLLRGQGDLAGAGRLQARVLRTAADLPGDKQ